jgi:hypothetical protein
MKYILDKQNEKERQEMRCKYSIVLIPRLVLYKVD